MHSREIEKERKHDHRPYNLSVCTRTPTLQCVHVLGAINRACNVRSSPFRRQNWFSDRSPHMLANIILYNTRIGNTVLSIEMGNCLDRDSLT